MLVILIQQRAMAPTDMHRECTICRQDLTDGDTVLQPYNCIHLYHLECLRERLFQSFSCPYCWASLASGSMGCYPPEAIEQSQLAWDGNGSLDAYLVRVLQLLLLVYEREWVPDVAADGTVIDMAERVRSLRSITSPSDPQSDSIEYSPGDYIVNAGSAEEQQR